MVIAGIISSGLKVATGGIGLAQTILKRKTPDKAEELGRLKIELIEVERKRKDEELKIDPNDELIQELYKNEDDLNEKITVYIELADAQLSSILS